MADKCRIGSGHQNEWYFFSHKDKKYPTGTRTNRATAVGFWKATGRDKAIYLSNSKRIGMRKTLVFYTGRAPHGRKTDWIMHEYRLDDHSLPDIQEDGWVVCRVFRKKNHIRGGHLQQPEAEIEQEEDHSHSHSHYMKTTAGASSHHHPAAAKQQYNLQPLMYGYNPLNFDGSMHLPHLSSPDSLPFLSMLPISTAGNTADLECSQHLLRLTSALAGSSSGLIPSPAAGNWPFLDKLLSNYQGLDQQSQGKRQPDVSTSATQHQKFPFPYLGCDSDFMKFSK
ncbi:hypothetical protein Nepgr_004983 [Nepenthes gracilis]|uniref:NAC domain-containing protein n=1 Tax=Nepenthes gracilis TaxID=150966 RepID=A0AAD3S2U7_NEPGR|nr:hypothetical protein Nepgr_004983 [Nepenthes gracilis]